MDIVVVEIPDVWGMLLSRKFVAMLGGTLEMDLTYINVPMKNGTIESLPNIPMAKAHVQEINNDTEINETHEPIKENLPIFSLEDLPFTSEEDFDEIQWPNKEEYQQLLDKYKDKEVGIVKLLKKGDDDILIKPSQQEVLTAESHPPPSRQYTRVIQETTKFETKEYQERDTVWMWDTMKGEPTNVKGNAQFWLGPFKIRMKSVNNAFYLSMLEGRKHPLPVSGCLLKPHRGAEN